MTHYSVMCQHKLVLIVPYDTEIYMTWKDAEADLMLSKPQRSLSTEGWKMYNLTGGVRKIGNKSGIRPRNYKMEEYDKQVLPHVAEEDQVQIEKSKVNVTRGGSCSFVVNGKKFGGNHLDYWANSIFNTDLNQ